MNNVMIDLETLGVLPGSIILSIGAVFFDAEKNQLGREFYEILNIYDQNTNYDLKMEKHVLGWWALQSLEALEIIVAAASSQSLPLAIGLRDFTQFLVDEYPAQGVPLKICVWGNGSDFDNALLKVAYFKAFTENVPWHHHSNRCFRTLKNLVPQVGEIERVGTHHNALDDAKTQALHAMKCLRYLNLSRGREMTKLDDVLNQFGHAH